jgi:hypothetical protein
MGAYGLATFFSPDGIHWSDPPLLTGSCVDRSTVFWNPFRKVWVYSLRHGWGQPLRRRYWEMKDPATGPAWSAGGEPPMWVGADSLDPMRDDYKVPCQLYNLDGFAYESLLVGLFTIWRGQFPDRQKPNELCVGFSRDGWNWTRPDRRPFILTRSAFLGQQRFAAATWSGDIGNDWETLRRQNPARLNMAAAGHPWWTTYCGGLVRPGPAHDNDAVTLDPCVRFQRSFRRLWMFDADFHDGCVAVTSQHRLNDQRIRQTGAPWPSAGDSFHGPHHSIDPLLI